MKSALREVPGCGTPEAPKPAKRHRPLSREEYRDGILRGDRIVLARAVTLIESAREADREVAEQIVEDCLPARGGRFVVAKQPPFPVGLTQIVAALATCVPAKISQTAKVTAAFFQTPKLFTLDCTALSPANIRFLNTIVRKAPDDFIA